MARPECSPYRDEWWEGRVKSARTPKAKVTVLQSKILADLSKVPEQHQDEARNMVALLLEGVIDEIAIKVAEREWVA